MEKVSYQNIEINRWDGGLRLFWLRRRKERRLLNWHANMSDGSVRDVIHWPENNANPLLQKVHGGIPILFPFAGACLHEGKKKTTGGAPTESFGRCPCTALPAIPSLSFAP